MESDPSDSSSSEDSIPLSRRKESSGSKRKAEVLSKLFPKESGKIGVTITTSPPNGSKVTKPSTPSGNKAPLSTEVRFSFIYYIFISCCVKTNHCIA